ncbi:unnamed protein product [Linum trigynum]|uniref:Uncharacterized protein n=1 Tax=Linum trigynum TaxID=586398 RepID=A0AAV2CTJ3_9ROSI
MLISSQLLQSTPNEVEERRGVADNSSAGTTISEEELGSYEDGVELESSARDGSNAGYGRLLFPFQFLEENFVVVL